MMNEREITKRRIIMKQQHLNINIINENKNPEIYIIIIKPKKKIKL